MNSYLRLVHDLDLALNKLSSGNVHKTADEMFERGDLVARLLIFYGT